MRAYSLDLRERVVADLDARASQAETARKYRMSMRWIYKLLRQRQETGDLAPRRSPTGPPRALAGREEEFAELVRQSPDATLEELRQALAVSAVTVWRALKSLGLTLKKK
jgi:putative transposase